MRYYVYLFFLVLFFLNVVGLLTVPPEAWSLMESWQIALYILPLATSFCIILISYWIWKDEESINRLFSRIADLRRKIEGLEEEKRKPK